MNQYNLQKNNDNDSRYLRFVEENMSVNPFGNNTVSDRAYKKTERLVLASYLITNHISEKDDLRIELRNRSRSLLEFVVTKNLLNTEESLAPLLLNIRVILTLIDLLFASQQISEINVNVLKRAFIDFSSFLKSSVGSLGAEEVDLNEVLDEKSTKISTGNKDHKKETITSVLLRATDNKLSTVGITVGKESKIIKNKRKNRSIKSKAISTNRRVIILDMVAKTGKVTVKDVAKQIPDTSPKTLQRELMSLVVEGVLKKEGNKRWTVYTLIR